MTDKTKRLFLFILAAVLIGLLVDVIRLSTPTLDGWLKGSEMKQNENDYIEYTPINHDEEEAYNYEFYPG